MKLYLMSAIISAAFFSMGQSKHSVSFQSGIFHSYFDQTPLMNFNYTSKEQGIFHGVFLGSNGLSYSYGLNQRSCVSAEATRLARRYDKNRYSHQFGDIDKRIISTYSIKYIRNVALNEKVQFQYGAGISYRNGNVYQYTVPSPLTYTHMFNESNFGMSTLIGFRYYLNQKFSLYTLFDFRSVLYFVNHEELNANPELHPGYPNRFDLSLKLGLSFHF
jgi:hypothetical protein